jgi:hypothetical protein
MNTPIHVNDNEFENTVLKSSTPWSWISGRRGALPAR